MKKVDYETLLTEEDKVRVYFEKKRGKVSKFIVQYYALIGSRWRTIMRVDNCHGGAHKHIYHLKDSEYRIVLGEDPNSCFTGAHLEVMANYKKIKNNYLYSK